MIRPGPSGSAALEARMDWFVNKQSNIPLYLQLKDFVKYSISTGVIQHSEKLPTIQGLAQRLGVNFETVRKAYKDLEREGLVSTERGVGTFVTGRPAAKPAAEPNSSSSANPVESLKSSIGRLLQAGKSAEEINQIVVQALEELARCDRRSLILFAECNSLQANGISAVLQQHLKMPVSPVLLPDLRNEINRVQQSGRQIAAVVTTGFHMNEVRRVVRDLPVDFVMTNMSPEVRRKVDEYSKAARYGFICRDAESKEFYPELLKAELGLNTDVECCLIGETSEVDQMLRSVDVLLVGPAVYEDIQQLAPGTLPIFNIQDRVDPLSLKMLRDRLLSPAS